jgi:hypothetical protein
MGLEACESLKRAVRKEIEKKALLGQHVIIRRNGKTCRVTASSLLKKK